MTRRALYDHVARLAKALASPERLVLLELLTQGERSVEILADRAGQTVQSTSHHLQKLASVGLVSGRREGRRVVYALGDPAVESFWTALRGFAESRSGELRSAISELAARRSEAGVVAPAELERLLSEGRVTLVDVRPEEEYRAGHLPGARSIPLEELAARLGELPRQLPVVVYCRGRYCLLADRAVALLREHGFSVRRLEEGVVEWSAGGHPLE